MLLIYVTDVNCFQLGVCLLLAGVNADLRYYIDTGNDQNSFQLDAKTGDLTVARKLDYETRYLRRCYKIWRQ